MQPKDLEFKLLDSLRHFRERIVEERKERMAKKDQCLTFGVQYLDECLGGIYKEDIILYGAKTGIGKTQLATITAMANAKMGKRVHFFALEAATNEIERRIKYQILSDMFFKMLKGQFPNVRMDYVDWYYGRIEGLEKVEEEIDAILVDMFPNLVTSYPGAQDYKPEDFEKDFLRIQNQTDLIILDHLHYFDFDDDNENRAMKGVIKQIKRLAHDTNVPVVLVSHLRKSDRRFKTLVPGLEDFHGSSDIPKIATKVAMLSPAKKQEEDDPTQWPTYIHAAKFRVGGQDRTRYVGLVGFDARTNSYNQKYQVGQMNAAEDEFLGAVNEDQKPKWAKSWIPSAAKEDPEKKTMKDKWKGVPGGDSDE